MHARNHLAAISVIGVFNFAMPSASAEGEATEFDIVIYGATPAGIASGIQASRMGKSAIVIETDSPLGGHAVNGFVGDSATDREEVGGIAREFHERLREQYSEGERWPLQTREEYDAWKKQFRQPDAKPMWMFEPSAALRAFDTMVAEADLAVVRKERLDRVTGVKKEEGRIVAIAMESGRTFAAKMFIDASYEGDLMASAGVHYVIGREANAAHGEGLNGTRPGQAGRDQFPGNVDPYTKRKDSESGLVFGVEDAAPSADGSGDRRLPAFCLRMCLTDHAPNRIRFEKPERYREEWYELMFRTYEAGMLYAPWRGVPLPNRKMDTDSSGPISTHFVGQNHGYPEASYARREAIYEDHLAYQQGLMWTLANHPRIPEALRRECSRWGLCKDEFAESGGWPRRLYVREARRMAGMEVLTEMHCRGVETARNTVAMAWHPIESPHVRRIVDGDGSVRNEGALQTSGISPYPVGFGSVLPKPEQCRNLLVPVCFSATHVAFQSAGREPVFMALGQAAATAAALAIDQGADVQSIDYANLRKRLLSDKQVLETNIFLPGGKGIDPAKLPGLVMDDEKMMRDGFEDRAADTKGHLGVGYRHDGNKEKGGQAALFLPFIVKPGLYEIRLAYTPGKDRATNVQVRVSTLEGKKKFVIDQTKKPPINGLFISLGRYVMNPGRGQVSVEVLNDDTDGLVVVDGIQFLPLLD